MGGTIADTTAQARPEKAGGRPQSSFLDVQLTSAGESVALAADAGEPVVLAGGELRMADGRKTDGKKTTREGNGEESPPKEGSASGNPYEAIVDTLAADGEGSNGGGMSAGKKRALETLGISQAHSPFSGGAPGPGGDSGAPEASDGGGAGAART